MAVTIKDVEYIAQLARLSFTPEEKERMTGHLNGILQHMEQLNRLDTSSVEPLTHVVEPDSPMRPDTVRPGVTQDEALKNAPDRSDEFFKVPKVIGDRNA